MAQTTDLLPALLRIASWDDTAVCAAAYCRRHGPSVLASASDGILRMPKGLKSNALNAVAGLPIALSAQMTSWHFLSESRTTGWHQRGGSGNSVSGLDYTTVKAVRGAEQEKEHTVAPLSNAPVSGSARSATLTRAAGYACWIRGASTYPEHPAICQAGVEDIDAAVVV